MAVSPSEEARRDEAAAAEVNKCFNVRLMTFRFPVLCETDDEDGSITSVECMVGTSVFVSSVFRITSGITPDGKEAESEMGSSLHSGHI